jgi:hypothetical protein
VLFSAGPWFAFLAGGGSAALLTPRWGVRPLALPVAALLLVAAIDLARHFAAGRRSEQKGPPPP